ncbi:hypothetical protein H5392_07265 [Tessaracoccus sp. MC1865]|uniref:hypothetical protein n=1 Tax=unclassified Tessaracoccus TaxID=2635419 RepID=UPI00096F45A1|nr:MULTISPECIES: hypothetical protein [unclassified Tessaracoccus]MBB1483660.1 hypothetical protein [Tessaracoccus sp. MC1865]MBB1508830.1 hypothetical protein [Tessaracoccus sp. MC1756]MCG6566104.1 hypothetical protein [Tessaracoccus sp. ZS01]OMG58607.1 hypothetical protein BJN44_00440 [Tessaracoccus sp. ZS01]QTO36733.1 hypothetical protein J7D54_09640 [Tessaracoccus sp. MC1865]
MGWFGRKKKQAEVARDSKKVADALFEHLSAFVISRRGVEAWVEQPTSFNKPSILLVAADGESTRRGVPSAEYGYAFAEQHHIPCYDAGVVPYPKRMREYGLRAKQARRAADGLR